MIEMRRLVLAALVAAAVGASDTVGAVDADPPGRTGTAAAAGDGVWAGSRVHTFYGYLKVEAVVSDGALTDVRVPEYPSHDGTSRRINAVAIPHLVKSAVASGGAGVDAISGATITSKAFARSLEAALQGAAR